MIQFTQGARRDLADSGIPEPKLGLVSQANGGVCIVSIKLAKWIPTF